MADFLNPAEISSMLGNMQKAIESTAVVGAALVREDLQQGLVVAGPMQTPLRNRLKRVTGNGNAHAFYRLKPNDDRSQGIFYGTTPGNGVFPKGGLPVDATENYDYVAFPYSNLGDVVQVAFQDQAQGRSYTDILAQRTGVKSRNVAMMEEYFLWNGDSSIVQSGGGRIFDGIKKQLTTLGGNIDIASDGKINVGIVAQNQHNIVDAGGQPRVCFSDTLGKSILTRQISQLLAIQQTSGSNTFSGMSGGLSLDSYDFGYGECPLIWDRYLTPDPYTGQHFFVTLDDQSDDQVNDGNVIQMVDVDAMHSVELATIGTAWRKVIYETTMMMISVPQFQGMITGLTYAGQSAAAG